MAANNNASALHPWFRLFRLPNLLTVPGDPLAGFLFALGGSGPGGPMLIPMFAAMAASVCLYMFGLALNDIADIKTDRLERPDRPLPSGQITVPQAMMAALAAALSGLNIALIAGPPALYTAGALAVVILAYNIGLKRVPVLGICAMGLCRALSFVLGLAAACPEGTDDPALAIATIGILAYTVSFSAIAKNEMAAEKPMGVARWIPFAVLLVFLSSVLMRRPPAEGVMPAVAVFLMCMAMMQAWMLGGMMYRLQPVSATVAGHIRNVLQVQAFLCVAGVRSAGLLPAFFLMALWLLFPRLAKRFYSS